MSYLATCFLLLLLTLPFAALFTDARARTEGLMLKVATGIGGASWLIAVMLGGLHQRPNVANIYAWAFVAWPFLLLVAKRYNPALSWISLWTSVPVMSWYLVNVSMQFYFPLNSPGLGAGLGLIAGWFYMVPPFAVLCGLFLGGRAMTRRIRRGPDHRAKAKVRITLNV